VDGTKQVQEELRSSGGLCQLGNQHSCTKTGGNFWIYQLLNKGLVQHSLVAGYLVKLRNTRVSQLLVDFQLASNGN
jgi:hypothetical protein